LSRGFDPASFPATPLVSFRSYRLLSGWNPPPQVMRALVAHQDARGPMIPISLPLELATIII